MTVIKTLFVFCSSILMVFCTCAMHIGKVEKNISTSIDFGGYLLNIEITKMHTLIPPVSEHSLFALIGEVRKKIESIEDLSEIVLSIKTPDQGLEYVRIFSMRNFNPPLLEDARYFEVFIGEREKDSDPWKTFISPKKNIGLKPPIADETKNGFFIERNVVLHPTEFSAKNAKLVRTNEFVGFKGEYKFNVKEIISEEEWVNELVFYYK